MGRMTQNEYITKVKAIHTDMPYDYSLIKYVNTRARITVICKLHGPFELQARSFITGRGCPICGRRKTSIKGRRPLFGVGINDMDGVIDSSPTIKKAYKTWAEVLNRCYNPKMHEKEPTYQTCSVSKEWRTFSTFREWFVKNYIDGYEIDKDILVKGNKVYSAKTCCFVPKAINVLFTKRDRFRGEHLIGVYKLKSGRYKASFTRAGVCTNLGVFQSEVEAFNAYKQAKEAYIKEVAEDYHLRGLIADNVYNALMKWTIEMTD